jgi:hypothetical protein
MKCFKYSNRPKAYITVKPLDEPYGDETENVISVGCTLKGDFQNPTWKVHIPLDLAESVGRELIRLARIDREKTLKTSRKNSGNFSTKEKTVELSSTHVVEDVKAASDSAISQGRVVKRRAKSQE